MARNAKRVAPYIPFGTFLTSLEVLSQGLPERLHPSIWRTFSNSVRTQVLSAFRFLGLVDDEGRVQSDLKRLLDGSDPRAVLREILEQAYPEIVELAHSNASPAEFTDAMRAYGVNRETLEKAERFFLQAAQYAELQVSPLWKKGKVARAERRTRKSASRQRHPRLDEVEQKSKDGVPSRAPDKMTVDLQSGGTVELRVAVDLTVVSTEDLSLVMDLIGRMRAYRDEQHECPALEPPNDLLPHNGEAKSSWGKDDRPLNA